MGKQKVIIPVNVEKLLELARQVAAKHAADGASSILNSLQDFSWNTLGPTIPTCLAKHREAENLRRQMEQAYEARDLLLPSIKNATQSSRDLLLGAFRATPNRLGDWGFDVSQSAKKPKPEPTT